MNPSFHHSPLVRLLAPWAPARAASPEGDLAERLSAWVGAFDAIGLQSTQRAIRAMEPGAASRAARVDTAALALAFEQARGTLSRAIAQEPALPNESGYAPYKRRHLELQRQMEQVIGALREHVREALGRGAPALRQLAALDAALEKVVARREQAALPRAIVLLERRFAQLRKLHEQQAKAAASGGDTDPATLADDPLAWRRPGGWLHAFEREWHQALQAELALRLQPVAGLVEAAGAELNDFS